MRKRINRKDFLEFLRKETKTKHIKKSIFSGKNIYFLTKDNTHIEQFQIEFISSTSNNFYTIYIQAPGIAESLLTKGKALQLTETAEQMYNQLLNHIHAKAENYLNNLNLGRSIYLDTGNKLTLIK